jgi:hypothetical protein
MPGLTWVSEEAERDGSVTKAIVLPAMRPDFPK